MQNLTMLVVDDEPDIRQLLRIFFERQGWTVQLASNGRHAIQLARQQRPHLILMDIQMPEMTGIDAVRLLRAEPEFAATPILAITAYARVHVAADVQRAGFNEVIYKPLEFGVLQETVQQVMKESRK